MRFAIESQDVFERMLSMSAYVPPAAITALPTSAIKVVTSPLVGRNA